MSPNESFNHFKSIVIVAGLSGAGKSTAMDLLADSGYFVVDNLPVALLANFLSFSATEGSRFEHTGLLLDIDSQENRATILSILGPTQARPANL